MKNHIDLFRDFNKNSRYQPGFLPRASQDCCDSYRARPDVPAEMSEEDFFWGNDPNVVTLDAVDIPCPLLSSILQRYIFKNLTLRSPSKARELIENSPLILDVSNDIPITDPVP